jgi:hypothetical protein
LQALGTLDLGPWQVAIKGRFARKAKGLFTQIISVDFLCAATNPRGKLIQALVLPEPVPLCVVPEHPFWAFEFNCQVHSMGKGAGKEVLEQRPVQS